MLKRQHNLYESTMKKVRARIGQARYVALAADGWADGTHGELMGITVIPLDEERRPLLVMFFLLNTAKTFFLPFVSDLNKLNSVQLVTSYVTF